MLTTLVTLAVVLSSAVADPNRGVVASTATSDIEPFIGEWTTPGGETIIIASLGRGLVSIEQRRGFLTAGAFDGQTLVATVPARARSRSVGILKLRLARPNTLVRAPSEGSCQDVFVEEDWRRAGSVTPAATAAPDLPAPGEYVPVDELPEAITKVQPNYPPQARESGVDGTVLMQVLVAKDGTVKDAVIVKGIAQLNDAALAAVRQWRFKPAMAKGSPVAVWMAVPMKFSLH